MNGIGIVGKLGLLGTYLAHFKSLLHPNGQILLDSSDIIYMYEKDGDDPDTHQDYLSDSDKYYGEVEFTMQYKGQKDIPFHWLYLDYNTLQRATGNNKFECELVREGGHYDYLAKLSCF